MVWMVGDVELTLARAFLQLLQAFGVMTLGTLRRLGSLEAVPAALPPPLPLPLVPALDSSAPPKEPLSLTTDIDQETRKRAVSDHHSHRWEEVSYAGRMFLFDLISPVFSFELPTGCWGDVAMSH